MRSIQRYEADTWSAAVVSIYFVGVATCFTLSSMYVPHLLLEAIPLTNRLVIIPFLIIAHNTLLSP